jgi:hypothetical protein
MVDELTKAFGPFSIVQGSYSNVGTSAGTHSAGGALDASDSGMGATQIERFVRTAREQGWAMWHRPDRPGVWSSHFHGIAIQPGGKTDRGVLSDSAHAQVVDYYEGRDGLAGDGPDPHRGLGVEPITFEQYLAGQAPAPTPPATGGTIRLGEPMLVDKAIRGVHESWWLVTPNGRMVSVTNDSAKTWTGPRITVLNTPQWNNLVAACPVVGA